MTDLLEQLFESARQEGLSESEMSALWNRVSTGVGGAGGGPVSGGGSFGAIAAAGKAVVALLIAGGVAGGVHLWSRTHSATHVLAAPAAAMPSMPQNALAPNPKRDVAAPADPVVLAPAPRLQSDLVAAVAHARGAAASVARSSARLSDSSRSKESGDVFREAPESASPAQASVGGSALSPTAASPSRAASQVSPEPIAPQQPETATSPAPASPTEASLLLKARRTLDRDPAEALMLTEEHARRFPAGSLAPEREILAVEALARLGRTTEARHRLDALRERFPNTANIARLESLIDK
jgi:hypothetical protein